MRSTIALVTVEAEAVKVAAATEFCRVASSAVLCWRPPNRQVEQSAQQHCCWVPAALCAAAPVHLKRWASKGEL